MLDLRRYSATQLSMYLACPRKWHFQYVGGFKPPATASQQIGHDIHEKIETACATGEPPSDPRARAGFETLIADVKDVNALRVEGEISISLPPAFNGRPRIFIGFIDAYDCSDRSLPVVTDHKTTSDLKYAKTSYELAEDVQMISYAKYVLNHEPQAEQVKLQHNAIPTRGAAKAILTSAVVERAHVESKWRGYLTVLGQMDEAHELDVSDVEAAGLKNGECERFGGCPHRERCLAAVFRKPARKEENEMSNPVSLTEKLAALRAKAKQPTTQEQAAPATETAPQSEAPAPDVKSKLAALRSRMGAAPQEEKAPATRAMLDKASAQPEAAPVDVKAKLAALKKAPEPTVTDAKMSVAPSSTASVSTDGDASRCQFLFLNCAPTQGLSAVRLESLVAPILETIQRETGLNWQLHEFRRGPGLIVDGIAASALPKALVVDTTTPLGKVCLEALLPRAEVVIVGGAA